MLLQANYEENYTKDTGKENTPPSSLNHQPTIGGKKLQYLI
jgi:hypothetical protein